MQVYQSEVPQDNVSDNLRKEALSPPLENPGFWQSTGLGFEKSWNDIINFSRFELNQETPDQDTIAFTNALNYDVSQGNGVGNFIGQTLGFASNPINWATDGMTGAAFAIGTRALPEAVGRNLLFKMGSSVVRGNIDFLPQNVSSNFDIQNKTINLKGMAEDSIIPSAISLIIPPAVALKGLLKARRASGIETDSFTKNEEGPTGPISPEETETPIYSGVAEKDQELDKKAIDYLNSLRPDLNVDEKGLSLDLMSPDEVTQYQQALGEALSRNGKGINKDLLDAMMGNSLEKIYSDPDKIAAVEEFVRRQGKVVDDLNENDQSIDAQIEKEIYSTSEDIEKSQKRVFKEILSGKKEINEEDPFIGEDIKTAYLKKFGLKKFLSKFPDSLSKRKYIKDKVQKAYGMIIPEKEFRKKLTYKNNILPNELSDYIRENKPNKTNKPESFLMTPANQIEEIRKSLFDENGKLKGGFFKTKSYSDLLELSKYWRSAQILNIKIMSQQQIERQEHYLQLGKFILSAKEKLSTYQDQALKLSQYSNFATQDSGHEPPPIEKIDHTTKTSEDFEESLNLEGKNYSKESREAIEALSSKAKAFKTKSEIFKLLMDCVRSV